ADAARMAERWYARHARALGHTFERKPLIFYADHPDFQQTNVIGGFISQGTGGVTESIRNRVVMPFTGIYAENDHVLGHELVHVFQYDIAGVPQNGGLTGLNRLPLWLVEGMAEYLSVGRDDPHTAMWLRDAALRNDLPTLRKLSTDPRYFPYRYGQALWAYIGGRWGDAVIPTLFRTSLRQGWDPAVRAVLRISSDSLSAQWLAAIRATYTPVMEGRQRPGEIGERVLERGRGRTGDMDVAPALSPDGRYVAFFTRRGLFSTDLYVADAATGRIVQRLTGPNTDAHFDALSFINSSGSWSPDGRKLAYVIFKEGDNQIAIFDVDSRNIEREIAVEGVGAISDPAWGPGNRIVFSGSMGGISDLYMLDIASGSVRRLTNDRHADLQPTWSPDGRTIAFATDRGASTDFERLTYGPLAIALLDVETGAVRTLPLFDGAKHINPQWSPDGSELFFVSDRGGFSDIYRVAVGADGVTGPIAQVTRLATGVSGITANSPALAVARETGRVVFSVFERAGNSLYRLEPDAARGEPVTADPVTRSVAGVLPPIDVAGDLVGAYLDDPTTGLPPAGVTHRVTDYSSKLSLDYLGTPGVGVGVGPRGAGFVGGVAGYFGDLLGDRVVGTTLQVQGSLLDTGGELFYLNQRRRWNWGAGASHIPYRTGGIGIRDTVFTDPGDNQFQGQIIELFEQRIFVDQLSTVIQYPFSQTRRAEFSASLSHQWYDFRVERISAIGGTVIDRSRETLDAPPGLTYGQALAAFVGDYSYFGFTSPVAGGRYRFEVAPTFGGVNFQALLADYRRYLFLRPVTLAFRGMHYGRYGSDAESRLLQPLFVGQESFIRGYDPYSFSADECEEALDGSSGTCPVFERLIGSRIGVANLELRIPLFGTDELGIFSLPFLPTEISPFLDAGVAWTSDDRPVFEFERNTNERVPVFSAGVSARFNLLGYAVLEAFYVNPFQRPGRGAHFGFQLAPGW
ncbi:MAG: peptidase S9, partial [Gemmatimonadota bacterium]|nr:peptidase S9 [Gemmatimonadota bacterium]